MPLPVLPVALILGVQQAKVKLRPAPVMVRRPEFGSQPPWIGARTMMGEVLAQPDYVTLEDAKGIAIGLR